jgi:hypothetical protein
VSKAAGIFCTIPTAFAFWSFALAPAPANNLFVAPDGSDAGLCSSLAPCATLARACDVANASTDRITSIELAPGTYVGGRCSVAYHRVVGVYGDCNSPAEIVLNGNDFAFFAQDLAILTAQCVRVRSSGERSVAFSARQYAIMDVNHAHIGELAQGIGLSAQETSRINCAAPLEVSGGAQALVAAGDKSTISLNCAVTFTGTPAFLALAVVSQSSLLNVRSATFSGSILGQKYICDNAEIVGASNMPGSGKTVGHNCVER